MWKIPLTDVDFDDREVEAIQSVIRSGWLSAGERVAEFERRFAEFVGVRHAIAVSNATAALHLVHVALGIGPGDEVILPSLHFVAGANSIVYAGGDPVFADIDSLDDLTISPDEIERLITPRTKAIQALHFAGFPCDMGAILEIARRRSLVVIEDACHAVGAAYDGKKCGAIGAAGCFSFYSNKNMTTGEGGMITTDDPEIAEKTRLLRCHGMTSTTHDRHRGNALSYDVVALGHNYRLDEIRAALGLVQLAKLEEGNARRERLACRYREQLRDVGVPFSKPHGQSSNHIFPIILDDGVPRAEFMLSLRKKGIQTSIHYPATHLLSFYRERADQEIRLPNTEQVSSREVTLPLFPTMSETQVDDVCEAVSDILRG
jgi:dTDP-4-amino-4,6-dideoxygalactose transaminase